MALTSLGGERRVDLCDPRQPYTIALDTVNAFLKVDGMLEATKLWTRTSAKGETYLLGRMGSLRVMVFENKYVNEGDPSHRLMVDQHIDQGKKE